MGRTLCESVVDTVVASVVETVVALDTVVASVVETVVALDTVVASVVETVVASAASEEVLLPALVELETAEIEPNKFCIR